MSNSRKRKTSAWIEGQNKLSNQTQQPIMHKTYTADNMAEVEEIADRAKTLIESLAKMAVEDIAHKATQRFTVADGIELLRRVALEVAKLIAIHERELKRVDRTVAWCASHLATTDWPGCETLGVKPVKPFVFFHVMRWKERAAVSLERMVICEDGSCVDREEAVGMAGVIPDEKSIARQCKEIRANGGGMADSNSLHGRLREPGIQAYRFNASLRTQEIRNC